MWAVPALSRWFGAAYGSKLSKPKNILTPWLVPLLLPDFFDDFSDWNVQAKGTSLSKSILVSVLSQKQKSKLEQFLHFRPGNSTGHFGTHWPVRETQTFQAMLPLHFWLGRVFFGLFMLS